jgi:radical SAM protein with 4Fe4S-binding SPASM domain
MTCLHCGSAAGKKRRDELSPDECLRVAVELLALGCQSITLIGGEVFLYRGWEWIARRLSDGGARVNIITNGFLMGDEQIEQIKRARLVNVGISLDGMERNHNRIRGVRTSFRRVIKAFQRLNREDIPIGVVTTLLDFNVADLEPMYELLVTHEIAVWQLQLASGMGNLRDKRGLFLKQGKLPEITRFIKDKANASRLTVVAGDDIGYFDAHEPFLRNAPWKFGHWGGCQAGLSVIGIDSNGAVKGCESLYDPSFIEGNVRTETLAAIWRRPGGFAYNRQFDPARMEDRCILCDKAAECRGGCRGYNYFVTASPFRNAACAYHPYSGK